MNSIVVYGTLFVDRKAMIDLHIMPDHGQSAIIIHSKEDDDLDQNEDDTKSLCRD